MKFCQWLQRQYCITITISLKRRQKFIQHMFFSVMILTWKLFQITKISTFTHRSSRQEMFCIKGVLRNLTKLTGKRLCQRLVFNKVAGLRPTTLLKKSLWNKCFAANFAKFLRTTFFTEHLRWLLLQTW